MNEGGGPRRAFRTRSLSFKLVVFSTTLTVAAVVAGSILASVAVRARTRRLLGAALAQHQQTLKGLQERSLDELLRISALMADSPTLRAAIDTYRAEAGPAGEAREELLATIQEETDRIASELGRDLLIVTDRDGRVLAASGAAGATLDRRSDLAAHPLVHRVLRQEGPPGRRNFAVLDLGGRLYRAGCVPIVLQGFLIGTLTVGDRLDAPFVNRIAGTFGCEVLAMAGGRVIGSTLSLPAGEPGTRLSADADGPVVVRIGAEDYVAVFVPLEADDRGDAVKLVLLGSLTKALGDSSRALALIVLACGGLAVVLAGAAAWAVSRSLLRPLEGFVAFMRAAAAGGDRTARFAGARGCVEVELLSATYGDLMTALAEHERNLVERAREDLERVERLKESEKLAALGRTLSSAAHEINNPLTSVIGNLELLLRTEALPAAASARLERVAAEGRRVAALVKNVLKISHRGSGEKALVDVAACLREIVEMRRHDFAAAGIGLALEIDHEPCVVAGSELELHQVFLNIVNNAYDALSGSGPAPRLAVRARSSGGRVAVAFEDNGPGMADPRKVFEHFYTTKPVGQGTGLGLAICFAIVQAHGGTITAANREPGGARFAVTLPAAEADPSRSVALPPAPSPAEGQRLDASVLVVDDESMIADLQKEILESLGAAVEAVGSGQEAIERLRERSFDLIVTDLAMPGTVSGPDLYRWVAANRPDASGAFLFVTGETAGGAGLRFIESVGGRCLAKPFSTTEFERVVVEALRGPRARA